MNSVRQIRFLGTGTSQGVPVIGCDCEVCRSENPRDKRTRTSLLLELQGGEQIIIDTSIDFRQQCLDNNIRWLDAVLITHCHADHVFGLDDVRRFNHIQQSSIPCYAESKPAEELKRIFNYVFGGAPQEGGGLPKLELKVIDGEFEVCGLKIIPLRVWHGVVEVTAFRINNIAYLTDCNRIPEESFEQLEGLDVLILDALRHRKHPTHFNLEEAVETAKRIGARRTYFTHIDHELGYDIVNSSLPEGMELAYDGLVVLPV
ncbi:MBL fold metallo-hydrolase [Candidatus Margulisiibacteriota bacterium]